MKISILTPSFNSGKFLEKAISSVLTQSYTNWEHIIADGGSTDNTIEIIQKYPHLKWVSEKDNGQSDAMNKAFSMSEGHIIVYLNADDWFVDGCFETVIDAFKSNPRADIITGGLVAINKNNKTIPVKYTTNIREAIQIFDTRYYFPWNPVAYFYKRKVQEQIGPFPLNEHFVMDFWFMLRAFGRYQTVHVDKQFGVFYSHGENKTSNHKGYEDCKRVLINYSLEDKKYNLIGFFYFKLLSFKFSKIKSTFKNKVKSVLKLNGKA